MTSDWLYPLSSASSHYFDLKIGRTRDTGPASFEQMVNEGALDDEWGVYHNWKNVVKGDRFWVYYGTINGDLGVVGLAYVKSVSPPKKSRGAAVVKLRWHRKKTHELLKTPFPALSVRKHIPRAQGAVWRIEPRLGRQLDQHIKTPHQNRGLTSWKGRYATGVSSTISYNPPREVTVERRHDELLRPLKIRLQSEGWIEVGIDVQSKRVDLAMKKGATTLIVEAKTVSGATANEVRSAFAQLMEYGWRVERKGKPKVPKPLLWAVFEKEPKQDEIEFLEYHMIMVSWVSKKSHRIIHSNKTARKLSTRGLN